MSIKRALNFFSKVLKFGSDQVRIEVEVVKVTMLSKFDCVPT